MKKALLLLLAMAVMSAAAFADVTYTLTFTSDRGTGSTGTGTITVADSVILSGNFFGNVGPSTVSNFAASFTGFEGSQNFGTSSLNTLYLPSNGTPSGIGDMNFWSYDRIASGQNSCPSCTGIYFAGVAPFTMNMVDNATGYNDQYSISAQVSESPEPASLVLLGSGLLGAAGTLRRRFAR